MLLKLLPLRRPSRTTVAAASVFVFALAVRLAWVTLVQSPYDSIFSDMAGYINRAQSVAYGTGDPYPQFDSLFPPGAHLIYAAQMAAVGWKHHAPFVMLHCVWGAALAPSATLLALRIVPRLSVAVALGVALAFWQPLLTFSGYFSSEQQYAGLLALNAWLLTRQTETGRGTIAVGVTAALAYLVRPQILLTLSTLAAVALFVGWRRISPAPRLRVGQLAVAGGILACAMMFGAYRYHSHTGRWGLISDNDAMQRLFADTDIGKVEGTMTMPDGKPATFFFEPPAKVDAGEHRTFAFTGYVGDPAILERARRDAVRDQPFGLRVKRFLSNISLLFVKNGLWPEDTQFGRGARRAYSDACNAVLLVLVCPLALLGIASCAQRPSTVLIVATAEVMTALVAAGFFYGQTRYRVPYDTFLFLLSLEGARRLAAAVASWLAPHQPPHRDASG